MWARVQNVGFRDYAIMQAPTRFSSTRFSLARIPLAGKETLLAVVAALDDMGRQFSDLKGGLAWHGGVLHLDVEFRVSGRHFSNEYRSGSIPALPRRFELMKKLTATTATKIMTATINRFSCDFSGGARRWSFPTDCTT